MHHAVPLNMLIRCCHAERAKRLSGSSRRSKPQLAMSRKVRKLFLKDHVPHARFLSSSYTNPNQRSMRRVVVPDYSRHLSEMMDKIAMAPEDMKRSIGNADELP